MYVPVSEYMHLSVGAHRSQEYQNRTPKLELVVVSSPPWVLGSKLWFSTRAASALN